MLLTYPDVACWSTSGQERRRLQKMRGCRSGGEDLLKLPCLLRGLPWSMVRRRTTCGGVDSRGAPTEPTEADRSAGGRAFSAAVVLPAGTPPPPLSLEKDIRFGERLRFATPELTICWSELKKLIASETVMKNNV